MSISRNNSDNLQFTSALYRVCQGNMRFPT